MGYGFNFNINRVTDPAFDNQESKIWPRDPGGYRSGSATPGFVTLDLISHCFPKHPPRSLFLSVEWVKVVHTVNRRSKLQSAGYRFK